MATGRVLVVHEQPASRALLTDLLGQEGLRVEAVDSTYECVARFIDDHADLVLMSLAGLDEAELDFIRTLKREPEPPRIVVTFPGPMRDLAVRALAAGADGYVLEPYYADELVGAVRGQLALQRGPAPSAALSQLAREAAHAINNPLQVMTLLFAKDRVTKKELVEGIPQNVARIETVVALLRDFGAIGEAAPEPHDVTPIAQRAAEAAGASFTSAPEVPPARLDPRVLTEALGSLLDAIGVRAGDAAQLKVGVRPEAEAVCVRVGAPRDAFADERPRSLLDAIFVVRPDREVWPGLARPRALLEAQGGSLGVEERGNEVVFVARLPLA